MTTYDIITIDPRSIDTICHMPYALGGSHLQERRWRVNLSDAAVFHDQDTVRVHDGVQAVGDCEDRAVAECRPWGVKQANDRSGGSQSLIIKLLRSFVNVSYPSESRHV